MRKFTFFLLVIIVFFGLPLYAAGRIILPGWLKSQIISSLPTGAEFSVSEINSNSDLSFVYDQVSYKYLDTEVKLSELKFDPRLSLSNPITLNSPVMTVTQGMSSAKFKDIQVKFIPSNISLNDMKFEGTVARLNTAESLLLSNIQFLVSEIKKNNVKFLINAEAAKFEVEFPIGPVIFDFELLETDITVGDNSRLKFKAEKGTYRLNSFAGQGVERAVVSKNIHSTVAFKKDDVFKLPFVYSSGVLSTSNGIIAKNFDLNAVGVWDDKSSNCEPLQFLKSKGVGCGKLIHVLDLNLLLGDTDQALHLKGNGLCVAKGSGCPQLIDAEISSVKTAEVFSNLMQSNIVNPLLSGVLLGALLSSPAGPTSEFEHKAHLKVTGSKIYLNGKSLLD